MAKDRVLAVIPARAGSKGLPGKNIRPFLGKPLLAHSLDFARACPEIDRCIVSTDGEELARVARAFGGDVPFLRPPELAEDATPMLPVLRHALQAVEQEEGRTYETLLLLDPTSPGRLTEDVTKMVALLASAPDAEGVIAVSRPTFNPFWVGVTVDGDRALTPAFDTKTSYVRRQDVPAFFRINGALYLWRRDYVLHHEGAWSERRHLGLEIPEARAFSIDDEAEFRLAELIVANGLVTLPWLAASAGSR